MLISYLFYKGTVAQTSPLDPTYYVELIRIAVSAALKCPHCTGHHMQVAMKMGATREEILEVILLSGMIVNSSVLETPIASSTRNLRRHSLRKQGRGPEGGKEESGKEEGKIRTGFTGHPLPERSRFNSSSFRSGHFPDIRQRLQLQGALSSFPPHPR